MLHWLSIVGAAAFMVFFFGFCVFIHEVGHFIVALWRGLHVDAFSLGFKRVWSWKHNGIEYRIGCIPFGGYVEIPQIDSSGEAKAADGSSLPKAKPFDRLLTVFAGPFFNILFGLFLGVFIWIFGVPQDSPVLRSFEIAEIDKASPEYAAGLREGDNVFRINGETFKSTWNGIVNKIILSVGNVTLDAKRGDQIVSISYFPAVNKAVTKEEELPYPFFRPRIPVVLYPKSGSTAAQAGVKAGDEVLKLNGKRIYDVESFNDAVVYSGGKPLTLLLLRNGKQVEIDGLKPEPVPDVKPIYQVGVGLGGKPLKALSVMSGMPAEAAGLRVDDELVAINGKPLAEAEAFVEAIRASEGKPVKLTVRRGGELKEFNIVPSFVQMHFLPGVRYAYFDHPNPFELFGSTCSLTYKSLRGIFVGLGNKMGLTETKSNLKARHLSGPLGIGKIMFLSFYAVSFMFGLKIVAIISFSLAIVNLLPVPVLDGGHIVIALYEMTFRRPPPPRMLQPVTNVFVALIIVFFLFVTFYDLKRVFPWAFDRGSAPQAEAAGASAAKASPQTEQKGQALDASQPAKAQNPKN